MIIIGAFSSAQFRPTLPSMPGIGNGTFAVFCSVWQCVAVCCSVLQCVAVCCSELQCVAECCRVLQGVAVCCRVLQGVAEWLYLQYRPLATVSLQCVAVIGSMLQRVGISNGESRPDNHISLVLSLLFSLLLSHSFSRAFARSLSLSLSLCISLAHFFSPAHSPSRVLSSCVCSFSRSLSLSRARVPSLFLRVLIACCELCQK